MVMLWQIRSLVLILSSEIKGNTAINKLWLPLALNLLSMISVQVTDWFWFYLVHVHAYWQYFVHGCHFLRNNLSFSLLKSKKRSSWKDSFSQIHTVKGSRQNITFTVALQEWIHAKYTLVYRWTIPESRLMNSEYSA